ncbi:MAG TPA: hypothetical protein VHZ95_09560, partial [Polyangiales bacterium]|nr:hypothetical protein [Polyangiales bacterium]
MSAHSSATGQSVALTRVSAAIGLCVVFALLFVSQRVTPDFDGPFKVVAAVGFLLLAGMRASQLLEAIGL